MTGKAGRPRAINSASTNSLRLDMYGEVGNFLAHGTGFLVPMDDISFLVTNRHNLTGKGADNQLLDPTVGAVPDTVRIETPSLVAETFSLIRSFDTVTLKLYDEDGQPLWYEHPKHGRHVDVVALPLEKYESLEAVGRYELHDQDEGPMLMIAEELFVIGFPFLLHEGLQGLATWTRANVASEPYLDFDGLPRMLIDARTRRGQSGSPVVRHYPAGIPQDYTWFYYSSMERLVGVYSGRVAADSDLGYVWRDDVVRDIIEGARRPTSRSLLPVED